MTLKTILAAALAASSALCQGLNYPADLQPGDQYRVLFVTDGIRDATSSDIADYDAFVAADASAVPFLASLDTNWRVVGGTATVLAREHTETDPSLGGVPIYRPDGVRVANDYANLWGAGGAGPLLAPPRITASGVVTTTSRVWTGSDAAGAIAYPLADSSGFSFRGDPNNLDSAWIAYSIGQQGFALPLYGISDVLTVPLPAVEQSRVGTPPNADALLPGQTSAPVIGQTWDPIVDHTTFVTDAAIDVLFFGAAQANVPLPGFGTVLIDQLLGSNLTALPGQTFSLAIPDAAALLGVSASTQALSLDMAWGMHLTNALDITIGMD